LDKNKNVALVQEASEKHLQERWTQVEKTCAKGIGRALQTLHHSILETFEDEWSARRLDTSRKNLWQMSDI